MLDIPWGRDDNSLIEPRQMGQTGVDVILRGEAHDYFPYAIECKSAKNIQWKKAVKQARENTKGDSKKWLVFIKTNEFRSPLVLMYADEFFHLYTQLRGYIEGENEYPEGG